MLYGELLFYKDNEIVKTVGDEEFSEFNHEQLQSYVSEIANEIGSTKVISDCVYHDGAGGSIKTVLFPIED